jgi:hypothetical protein
MGIGLEFWWVSSPVFDYAGVCLVYFCAFFPLKFTYKFFIVNVLGIGRQFIHYLYMFRSERADDDPLAVHNASGLHVRPLQSPTDHVVVCHESWARGYFMKFRLYYVPEFVFRIIEKILDVVVQGFKNLPP